MPSQSCAHVQHPRTASLLGDDIDDTSGGIAPIKSTGCSLHNLDAPNISHVQTGEIHIVQRFASQSFSIHQEQHTLSAKSVEIQMYLLIHGVGKLYAWQFLLQQVLDVGSIGALNVFGCDEPCLNGHILQQFGCTGSRHHHVVQIESGVNLFGE